MKTPRSRVVAWALLIVLLLPANAFAENVQRNYEYAAVDMVVARPCWLVASIIGTGLFIVALPVAAASKSVNRTARTLVVKPFQATFTRPLGDFSSLE